MARSKIVVDAPVTEELGSRLIIRSAVAWEGPPLGASLPPSLIFDMSANAMPYLSLDRMDAYAIALLVPAIERGADLHLRGSVCPLLLDAINTKLVPVLLRYFSTYSPITVSADGWAQRLQAPSGKTWAAGFSSGVDSYYTYYKYAYEGDPRIGLGLFLFNDVGQFKYGPDWRGRVFRLVSGIARRIGIPIVDVNSNLTEFYGEDFGATHSLRNSSVPLLLQKQLTAFFYSAAYQLYEINFESNDMADIEGLVLPLCSTASLRVTSAGSDSDRIEKTAAIATYALVQENLHACTNYNWKGEKLNCSRCGKCTRTIAHLYALGLAERFDAVFDLTELRTSPAQLLRRFYVTSRREYLIQYERTMAAKGRKLNRRIKAQGVAGRLFYQFAPRWLKWRLRLWLPHIFAS